ncbi:GPI mannosyltransferase 1 [Spathaspora sp. JA1]|nr:GPI mannosyltransferase 1 [Spathaspora sp. JA1]
MIQIKHVLIISIILRIAFFGYGLYQDKYMLVNYTDIDYLVFSDASKFVYNGESPYLRETYRYTPLLSWFLIPNNFTLIFGNSIWYSFGKVLFMICDLITGYLIIKLLDRSKGKVGLSAIWLLNPMVITISTRGSSESILTVMIMLSVYYLLVKDNVIVSGIWLGIAIHFKIYPIIYLPSILLYLQTTTTPIIQFPILNLINWKNLKFFISTILTLSTLTLGMYWIYGYEFIDNSYLYHLIRLDHRHNFSVYNMALYYKSALPSLSTSYNDIEKFTFIPQFVLSSLILPLTFARIDIISTLFLQTFTFVMFNKVITSQYFIWFLIFLPHYLSKSSLLTHKRLTGLVVLLSWVISQGVWLYFAYLLEFEGINTFDYGLLYASVGFYLCNCWCLAVFIETLSSDTEEVAVKEVSSEKEQDSVGNTPVQKRRSKRT